MKPAASVQRAKAAWGDDMPDWVAILAEACDRQSQVKVARQIQYSSAVVNQVLSRNYNGDLKRVQAAVEGAFKNAEVECPVLGAIKAHRCIQEQRKPFRTVSAQRIRMHRACRGGCPHFYGSKEK